MKTIRNESDRTELCSRIEKLTGNETPAWGRMNVAQMVSHLVQSGQLPFENILPDGSNFLTKNIVKPLALYLLPMPKEVKTPPDFDQQQNGRKPGDFAEDKRMVIEAINRIGTLPLDTQCEYH